MTLDIAKFHRTTPMCPHHKAWFVILAPDGTYRMEHDCPFGCASSSSNAGMIGSAVADILECEGVGPCSKYEDDFTIFRAPAGIGDGGGYVFDYAKPRVLEITKPLGVPWHPEKGQDFAEDFVSIGFLWDLRQKRVLLPEKKRVKFWRRCYDFLRNFGNGQTCTLQDVESLHGSLCHIAFVYPAGRSYLPALSNFATEWAVRNRYARRLLPSAVKNAVGWWEKTLQEQGAYRCLVPRGPVDHSMGLYVDASTSWGIGLVWGWNWEAWRALPGWQTKERHIGWAEGAALELLTYALEARGIRDVTIRVFSDNTGIIGAIRKGRSRNTEINSVIRRMSAVLDSINVVFDLEYIVSELNPADPLSRGVLGDPARRLQSITLPPELSNFFTPG